MGGYVLDAGIQQGLARESEFHQPPADFLRESGGDLVTIGEVVAECLDVQVDLLTAFAIRVEPPCAPAGPPELLDAFSSGSREVWWSLDPLSRADRAVVAHAIADGLDVLTTDRQMRERLYREFLRRLDRLPKGRLALWRIPEIVVVRRRLVM